jgi:hypothetical protein
MVRWAVGWDLLIMEEQCCHLAPHVRSTAMCVPVTDPEHWHKCVWCGHATGCFFFYLWMPCTSVYGCEYQRLCQHRQLTQENRSRCILTWQRNLQLTTLRGPSRCMPKHVDKIRFFFNNYRLRRLFIDPFVHKIHQWLPFAGFTAMKPRIDVNAI